MSLNRSKIKAIFFDVDGTLRDSDDEYVARFAKGLRLLRFALPGKDEQKAARWLVMQIESPANIVYGIPDLLGIDDELADFGEWLRKRGWIGTKNHKTTLVEGADDMLKTLAPHFPMTVISARGAHGTQAFLDQFKLNAYFQAVASAQTVYRTKPHPAPLIWCAQQLNVSIEACLMIGDTTVDIKAGKAAGTQTLGVLSGFGEEAELLRSGADEITNSIADLPALLGM